MVDRVRDPRFTSEPLGPLLRRLSWSRVCGSVTTQTGLNRVRYPSPVTRLTRPPRSPDRDSLLSWNTPSPDDLFRLPPSSRTPPPHTTLLPPRPFQRSEVLFAGVVSRVFRRRSGGERRRHVSTVDTGGEVYIFGLGPSAQTRFGHGRRPCVHRP